MRASFRSQPYYILREKLRMLYGINPKSEENYSMMLNNVRVSYSINYRTFSLKQGNIYLLTMDLFELTEKDPELEVFAAMIAGVHYQDELKNWTKLRGSAVC